jgi:hypothetical protein
VNPAVSCTAGFFVAKISFKQGLLRGDYLQVDDYVLKISYPQFLA